MSREKKKESLISITHIVQGLNIFTSQNSITENGIRLNILYWYKTMVRCKHLVPRILQCEFRFSSWLKVNKISNQIVHDQSATKFASMLQDIKKLPKKRPLAPNRINRYIAGKNASIKQITTFLPWKLSGLAAVSNSIAICSIRFVDKNFENLKHRLPITDWFFGSMPSLFTPCTSGKIHVRVYAVTGELQIRLHSLPLEHYVTRNVIGCFRRPHTWAHAR